jgi:hypothetical protein
LVNVSEPLCRPAPCAETVGMTEGFDLRPGKPSRQNGADPGPALDDLEGLMVDLGALIAAIGRWGPGEEREEFARAYLDILLSHRQAVWLLWRDSAELRTGSPVARCVTALNRALHDRVVGREADLEGAIRFAVALSGTFATVAAERRLDVEVVRKLGIQANRAALGECRP